MPPVQPFDRFRTGLLLILVLALLGTLAELVLLEHYEDWQQWVPLAVLAASALAVAWDAARGDAASRRVLQACMGALVVAGLAGVVLHLEGNLEFEREISPELTGVALWLEVARGATPALAPGSLIPFGLLGLLYTRFHPLRTREDS